MKKKLRTKGAAETVPTRGPEDQTVPTRGPEDQTIPTRGPEDQTFPTRGPEDQTVPTRRPASHIKVLAAGSRRTPGSRRTSQSS
ncbi:hypothetical protein NHX12_033312 [Muraenolepis orangiensis]|uniref:Uncharacterized protein n=1 Tax=Muraenolepis orangiensis TaxID=630683 RepID=A0A9Q0IHV0_9TELE|nr:hypothetical protein NHX12_033312 [Muraenolepis orangiensis]